MDERKFEKGIYLDYGGVEVGDGHLVTYLTLTVSTDLPLQVMRHMGCDLMDAINEAAEKVYRSLTGNDGIFRATFSRSPSDQEVSE